MNAARPASGLRAVFDTNVFVSAFLSSRGVPFRIWTHALRGRFQLVTSPPIISEIAGVLRDDMKWNETAITAQVKSIARVAEIVVPRLVLKAVKADDDDNRILECAVEGKASLIVSGDHHLLDLKSFRDIGIVRPIDFYRTLCA